MKQSFLFALMVVILGLIVVGCDSAGAGDGGPDTTQDGTPDDGSEDDGSEDDGSGDDGTGDDGTGTNGPADVPEDSSGAVDGTAYGYLVLEYYGELSGSYNTDLYLLPDSDSSAPQFYLELWDATDTTAIDSGTYTVDTNVSEPAEGTITWIDVLGAFDGETVSYAASTGGTESEFESDTGLSVDVYDRITGGTVTISVSGSDYTVAWTLTTSDGQTLEGTYTGEVDEEADES